MAKELIINSEKELLDLANSLGQPISSRVNSSLIDNLTPQIEADAHAQSLSANYGTNHFPFHTDGAYFKIPPRFIILRYIKGINNPTPTIICDLKSISNRDKVILKHAVWKIKSRQGQFLSTILSENEQIFRYDTCVMAPALVKNDNSKYFEGIIDGLPKKEIQWTVNKTIVLDNWTYLHARPQIQAEEVNYRTLQRIMIL